MLDVHSTRSIFLYDNEFGHPVFDTKRTEMGELLYRLKYNGDFTSLAEIGEISEHFIKSWGVDFNIIVPIPPTRTRRIQPVFQIADELAKRFGVQVIKNAVKKLRSFKELKDVHELEERRRILDKAFMVDHQLVNGKRILLVDDLIRSGATMNATAEVLKESGATVVFAFTLTQTRRK